MIVVVKNISKTYSIKGKEIKALNDVSFSVDKGEIFALLGPNGAGKTTLFNIFANLTRAESGEINVLGQKTTEKNYFSNIAFVSSETQFLWTLNVAQILKFYQTLYHVSNERVAQILQGLELESKLNRKWHQMSSGECMRVRIAKGLLNNPKVLFLDEPTVGLDPDISDKLRKYLKNLQKQGLTIILTSHLMLDVETLANRMCFIKQGNIIYNGTLGADFFKPYFEITFKEDLPNLLSENFIKISAKTIKVESDFLPEALKLGEVLEVKTEKNDLESLFIKLSRTVNVQTS